MSAGKFRKKPVVIEAMQWTDTTEGVTRIIDWVLANGGSATYTHSSFQETGCSGTHDGHVISVYTLEGVMHAIPGEWIIRGVAGEFYPCPDDIFQSTYEAVTE